MLRQANSLNEAFSPTLDKDNLNFELKIGGTTYEVCTRFNINGKQSVLEQFKNLIFIGKFDLTHSTIYIGHSKITPKPLLCPVVGKEK